MRKQAQKQNKKEGKSGWDRVRGKRPWKQNGRVSVPGLRICNSFKKEEFRTGPWKMCGLLWTARVGPAEFHTAETQTKQRGWNPPSTQEVPLSLSQVWKESGGDSEWQSQKIKLGPVIHASPRPTTQSVAFIAQAVKTFLGKVGERAMSWFMVLKYTCRMFNLKKIK